MCICMVRFFLGCRQTVQLGLMKMVSTKRLIHSFHFIHAHEFSVTKMVDQQSEWSSDVFCEQDWGCFPPVFKCKAVQTVLIDPRAREVLSASPSLPSLICIFDSYTRLFVSLPLCRKGETCSVLRVTEDRG